jgi:hypothetical protein
MKTSKGLKAILIVVSLPLLVFGAWRLLDPAGFYAFNGLASPSAPGMLSGVRGAGGVIAVSGIIVLLGAFRASWTFTSTVLGAVVFLSLGLGRVVGVVLDGVPNREVVQGMVIELVFGVLALFAYFKSRATSATG